MNKKNLGSTRTTILLLTLLLAVAMLLPKAFCVAGTEKVSNLMDTASTEIAQADAGFNQAFKTVLAAEQAGANVTGLLGQLDEAEGNVTAAKADYTARAQMLSVSCSLLPLLTMAIQNPQRRTKKRFPSQLRLTRALAAENYVKVFNELRGLRHGCSKVFQRVWSKTTVIVVKERGSFSMASFRQEKFWF